MTQTSVFKKCRWQKNLIKEIQQKIKAELDEISTKQGNPARLSFIQKQIQALESDQTPDGQMKRFIYVVSALIHQERFGGLKENQIERLSDIAEVILKVQGIKPVNSTCSFLFGELYLALSQIRRKKGQHWASAWDHQVGFNLSKNSPPGGQQFQSLVAANRALRLGLAKVALDKFEQAESGDLPQPTFERIKLGKIKTLRLSGELEKSALLLQDTKKRYPDFSPWAQLELVWEETSLHLQKTGDISEMVKVVKRDASHWKDIYLLECFIRTRTLPETNWIKMLPRMRTLNREKSLGLVKLGFLYNASYKLEQIEDDSIPLFIRLRQLGKILANTHRFVSIDTEMIYWVAAARWLKQNDLDDLCHLAIGKYKALSMSLTNSVSCDALNLFDDLSID